MTASAAGTRAAMTAMTEYQAGAVVRDRQTHPSAAESRSLTHVYCTLGASARFVFPSACSTAWSWA